MTRFEVNAKGTIVTVGDVTLSLSRRLRPIRDAAEMLKEFEGLGGALGHVTTARIWTREGEPAELARFDLGVGDGRLWGGLGVVLGDDFVVRVVATTEHEERATHVEATVLDLLLGIRFGLGDKRPRRTWHRGPTGFTAEDLDLARIWRKDDQAIVVAPAMPHVSATDAGRIALSELGLVADYTGWHAVPTPRARLWHSPDGSLAVLVGNHGEHTYGLAASGAEAVRALPEVWGSVEILPNRREEARPTTSLEHWV
jgi:hypothetical protein